MTLSREQAMEVEENVSPTPAWISKLKDYLLCHEDDIAGKVNDFGNLAHVFVYFICREPLMSCTLRHLLNPQSLPKCEGDKP